MVGILQENHLIPALHLSASLIWEASGREREQSRAVMKGVLERQNGFTLTTLTGVSALTPQTPEGPCTTSQVPTEKPVFP